MTRWRLRSACTAPEVWLLLYWLVLAASFGEHLLEGPVGQGVKQVLAGLEVAVSASRWEADTLKNG